MVKNVGWVATCLVGGGHCWCSGKGEIAVAYWYSGLVESFCNRISRWATRWRNKLTSFVVTLEGRGKRTGVWDIGWGWETSRGISARSEEGRGLYVITSETALLQVVTNLIQLSR